MQSSWQRFCVQDASVVVAAYNVKVDTIALLQTSNADEKALFGSSAKKVLSVVAFACVSPTVSDAHLFCSFVAAHIPSHITST
jgi:hypothetical protein